MANEIIIPVAENLVSWLTGIIAALGGVILLYLIFQSIMVYINRKKEKGIENINKKLTRIEELLKQLVKKS